MPGTQHLNSSSNQSYLESQNIRAKDSFSILTFNGKVTYFSASPSKQVPNDSPISPSLHISPLKPPAASAILLRCLSTWAINGSEELLWMTHVVPPTGTGSEIAAPSSFMGIHSGAIVLPRGHNILDKIVNQFLAVYHEPQATFWILPQSLLFFYMKRPYVIINIRLRNGSHSKCQATKLPLKIKSLPSSKGRLKGGMEKSQIQRTLQIKWSWLTKHILQKHTWCFSAGAAPDKMWVLFEKDIISNEFWKCHTEYWSIESCRQRDQGQQRAIPVIQFSELTDTSSPRQMASASGRRGLGEGRWRETWRGELLRCRLLV